MGVIDVNETSLRLHASKVGMTTGTFSYRGRDIYALDTREIILPDGHPSRCDTAKASCHHIVMLEGCNRGLMCDEVGTIVNLNRQDVEWRLHRQSKPWLAGMLKEYNHALLDIRPLIHACEPNNSSIH